MFRNKIFIILFALINLFILSNRKALISASESQKYNRMGEFSEGLALIEQNGKYGYIDTQGNIAIAPQYDEAGNFSEGLVAVVLDDKSFFIDGAGNVAIALKDYDAYTNYREEIIGGGSPNHYYLYSLSEFNNGVAEVSKPELPKDYQYQTIEEANSSKSFLCNTVDRAGKTLDEDRLCEIKSVGY